MKVSIVVPAHNEDKIIGKTLSALSQTLRKSNLDYEIVAVDDDSSDGTLSVMRNLAKKDKRIKPVHNGGRKKGPTGLGSAITFGFKHAKGEVLIPFMGDLSDDPEDVIKLVKKMEEGYDIVCASRFVKGGKAIGYPPLKLIAHRVYNKLFSIIFGLGVEDFSNAFKAYRKKIFDSIRVETRGFEFSAEVMLKAHILGFKITEVPVKWYNRKAGMSKLGSFSPTLGFVFLKLPKIGWNYGKVAVRLYAKFLVSKFKKFNKL